MKNQPKLSKYLSIKQFDNGYWYASDLKAFAKEIGIAKSAKLRKDELEPLIKHYLKTGKVLSAQRKNINKKGIKDCDRGLRLKLPVKHYTSNKETKDFIELEALKINPTFKRKSGAQYRLNRWRDEQITKGNEIKYGDLVTEYIRLNLLETPFEKIPTGRYINFLAEYLSNETKASRKEAIAAWEKTKKLDIPKDYTSWKKRNR